MSDGTIISGEYRGVKLSVLVSDVVADATPNEVLTEAVNVLLYAFEDAGLPGLTRDDLVIRFEDPALDKGSSNLVR